MKLISMTDFVLELAHKYKTNTPPDDQWCFYKIINYANFLKQPLKLEMFVPCDEEGNVLEEPQLVTRQIGFDEWEDDYDDAECAIYKQAKEKVLFEGLFRIEDGFGCWVVIHNDSNSYHVNNKNTIEDLINYDLTLTESAIKQIGL